MRRSNLFRLGVFTLLVATLLTFFTGASSAHHPELTASVVCGPTPGTARITVVVTAWDSDEPTHRHNDRIEVIVAGQSQFGALTAANGYSFTVTFDVPADGATHVIEAIARVDWGPNQEFGSGGEFRTVTLTMPVGCVVDGTTTTRATTTTTTTRATTTTATTTTTLATTTTTRPSTTTVGASTTTSGGGTTTTTIAGGTTTTTAGGSTTTIGGSTTTGGGATTTTTGGGAGTSTTAGGGAGTSTTAGGGAGTSTTAATTTSLTVGGTVETRDPSTGGGSNSNPTITVAGAIETRSGGSLARTGSTVAPYLFAGGTLLLVGLFVERAARRRTRPQE